MSSQGSLAKSEISVPGARLDQYVASPLAGRTLGQPDSAFVVAEWSEEGGPPDPPRFVAPLHVHFADDEAWYVLEGALRFRLDDAEVDAPAGAAVFAPRGVPHTYWNPRAEPCRYLLIMTPNTRSLIDELHSGSGRSRAEMRAVYRKHDCDLIEP